MSSRCALGEADSLARPRVYSSGAIQKRRRRILRETRRLIAERGTEGLTIRELCRRAGVAQRTIYNAFESRDRLIAIAIREAYEEVNAAAAYTTSATSLVGMLDRLVTVNRRNFRARNYTLAVTALYFSPQTHHDVWEALRQMSFRNLVPWLDHLQRSGQIRAGLDVDQLAALFANQEYATIHDWALGRIANADYLSRLVNNFLLLAMGMLTGDAAEEAQTLHRRLVAVDSAPASSWSGDIAELCGI